MALKRIRLVLASIVFTLITLLFLDFTGTLHLYLGWLAKIQFLPALLALNVIVIAALVAATLLFGRIYCSVICPLGILQDGIAWIHGRSRKNRYSYSKPKTLLRWVMLAVLIIAFVAGIGSLVALLAPYSSFGRIVGNLFVPLYGLANNGLAMIAEHFDSYLFYQTDVWIKSLLTFIIALATFVAIFILAWRNGRTYCNTVCPVGTVLGFLSRFSWFKIHIDKNKCVQCGLCTRNCKASCIDFKNHSVDYSRCVVCGDCIGKCRKSAITYSHKSSVKSVSDQTKTKVDEGKRAFLIGAALATGTAALGQQKKKVDGGLAAIEDKVAPERNTRLVPPGAHSISNFEKKCTACQLCVTKCPNGVLRPSTDLLHLMQPTMSYEHGYCRPECTACSEVCPTGAIQLITKADKSSTHIGHAVWVKKNCLPLTNHVMCGNCARHCPVGAITMVPSDSENPLSPRIPVVNEELCIGCGACENLCPARPFSAIYVEGHEVHRLN